MNLRTFEELHTSIKMQLCDLYHIEQNIVIVDLEEMRTVGSLVPGYLLKSFMRAPLPFWPHRSTSLAVSYLENKEPITSKLKSSENPQRIIYGIYMMDPLLRAPRGSSTPWWWWKESQAKKKVLQASTFHFPGSSSAPLKKKREFYEHVLLKYRSQAAGSSLPTFSSWALSSSDVVEGLQDSSHVKTFHSPRLI